MGYQSDFGKGTGPRCYTASSRWLLLNLFIQSWWSLSGRVVCSWLRSWPRTALELGATKRGDVGPQRPLCTQGGSGSILLVWWPHNFLGVMERTQWGRGVLVDDQAADLRKWSLRRLLLLLHSYQGAAATPLLGFFHAKLWVCLWSVCTDVKACVLCTGLLAVTR